jgi:hypothetical protein
MRGIYLDKWATADLRGSGTHEAHWIREDPNRWTLNDGSLEIGTEPDNIFYFVQVCKSYDIIS